MKRKLLSLLLATFSLTTLRAQDPVDSLPPIVDGYQTFNILEKASPFDYPKVDPTSIKFYKRIWRDVDLSLPQNQVLATPGSELINIFLEGIKARKIGVYDPSDDAFKKRLTSDEAEKRLKGDSVTVPTKYDDQGNAIEWTKMLNDFNPEKIVKFRLKEDVFYDKQRSRVETRIIGIAPLMRLDVAGLDSNQTVPAFWLYFPHCRHLLVSRDISDPDRGIADMTLDDFFVQRKFSSVIIRDSNPAGLRIADYAKDSDSQKKEAQRIEQGIQEYKKKVWTVSQKVETP
ncbi:gliding motility protein GldN [Desertivirga xinjiangensis]|uniref:type IX secretion system ring protein PorN/GldN n=1 Tax=Desertivirga xinjiangensis TaxID=539206 RepID=UPI00210A2D78|nr:gliding motility protein GldN [Pedobacter xinjiangensis]